LGGGRADQSIATSAVLRKMGTRLKSATTKPTVIGMNLYYIINSNNLRIKTLLIY